MIQQETELLFATPWGNTLPTEICLFAYGETDTKKGKFLFDELAGEMVMAAFTDSGLDRLPFDIGHGMVKGSDIPDAHRAFGWFVPVVKEDLDTGKVGLYASQIEWTDAGSAMLKAREFRFFSPAITFDAETRRITSLINVALTNLPATKNQRPLVLDSQGAQTENEKDEESMKILLDSLGAADESGAVAKVGEFKAALSALGCDVSEAAEKIAALHAQADAGIKAQAELARVTKEHEAAKLSAKIEALCAEGKLLPSQKEFAASLSAEQLDRFASTLSVHPASKPRVEEPRERVASLSAEEAEIAAYLGLSHEDFLAEKAKKGNS